VTDEQRPGGHEVPAHETKAVPGLAPESVSTATPRAVRAAWWAALPTVPTAQTELFAELRRALPGIEFIPQDTRDGIPTVWVHADSLRRVLRYLKIEAERPFRTLYDLGGIDERLRVNRQDQPAADFTVFYHLLSYERNADVRVKVPLSGEYPAIDTIVDIWPSAEWHERELWDMFGITVEGHPHLYRILNPPWWEGHPLRKEAPSRGTELGLLEMPPEVADEWQETLRFKPEEWHLPPAGEEEGLMYLNVGPQHGATHGPLRVVVGLRDEEIVSCVVDVGYHHRAQEKMSERQTWHTYIPYTDRIDYLGGVLNNMAYVSAVETLAGIEVPERAQVIRVMLCEFYRLASHLVYYGTFAQDIGALSPVFYMFSDREFIFDITEAICGGRMHPNWFRIGGVVEDLPNGWHQLVSEFLDYLPPRLDQYDRLVMQSSIMRARARGVGPLSVDDAIEWGVTGTNLRATGFGWDVRKARPYSGYDQFEFEVPVGSTGDCYDRVAVHVEEMRQSLRIIRQCLENMPAGPCKADHPLATPPVKEPGTMHHIETLITHFLGVTWGPVIPAGEAAVHTEGSKGNYAFYCISDGGVSSYRTKIRTASFPHLQIVPLLCLGYEVADLVTILGSLDYVMGDVDK
jgi:NADH-quinone oxidoreductase subunit C/D